MVEEDGGSGTDLLSVASNAYEVVDWGMKFLYILCDVLCQELLEISEQT